MIISCTTHHYKFRSLFFCVIGSLILFSCENDINEVNALNSKGINTEEAVNIESYLSVGGKTKARLTAPLMVSTEKDTMKMIFPKTLHVIFYDDSTGAPTTFLFAKYGIYYKSLKKVYLKDSIIGTNINGDTLRTTELWWDQNTEMIYGSKPTILKQSNPYGITPSQNGFSARQDFTEFIFNNVNNGIMQQDSSATGL
ncbi:MAG: LPS export ABC transporter periplasmic protein LptC [Arachidicoccus sp.]|nr:LPS export ABC transporter periplasmic protein LptC [Arachidicoccus sp.]